MLTKRVATLGPSTDRLPYGDLVKFLDLVDGVRINLAHATPGEVEQRVALVRRYERERGRHIAIVVDLRGSGVRVGKVPPLYIKEGDVVVFKNVYESSGEYIPVPARVFFQTVEPGDVVLMLDGKLRLRIDKVSLGSATAVAESSGVVETGKAVVIEGKDYDLPIPSEDDIAALKKIRLEEVDYISISLVKSCRDVEATKGVLKEFNYGGGVMAKIETKGAVENLEELASCSDYIVVARGDLGLHYGLEALPLLQRRVVEMCIKLGRPVAVATQLLDSLQLHPTPTRAEVNDVFTTASLGVDSLWLTGETASGKHPLAAAAWLTKILNSVHYDIAQTPTPQNTRDQFAKGLVEMAKDLGAKILLFSMSGTLAKRIAKFRPLSEVYVGTPDVKVARSLALIWALRPVYIPAGSYEEGLEKLMEKVETPQFVATYGIRGGVHIVKVRFQR